MTGMITNPVGCSLMNSTSGVHYLSVLEYGFLVNVLLLARVFDVGLHPTDVLTPTKTPLL